MAALKFPFVSQSESVLKSYHLTLSNDDNIGPNTASSFTSRIVNPIQLQGPYDVGLEEIRYFEKKPSVPPAPAALVHPIFPNLKKPGQRRFDFVKTSTDIATFITETNTKLEEFKVPLRFTFAFGNNEKVLITARVLDTAMRTNIVIPSFMAQVLGFRRKNFTLGTFPAQQYASQELFDQIPLNTTWAIEEETLHDSQNLIQIRQNFNSLQIFTKELKDKTHMEFLTRMNQDMNQMPLAFSVLFPESGSTKFGIKFEGGEFDYVRIPQQLVRMFGFVKDTFTDGEYWSTEDFNMEEYTKVEIAEPLFFMSSFSFVIYKPMEEPENTQLFTVLSKLNETINTDFLLDQEVKFEINENCNFGLSELRRDDLSVTLPTPLCKFFLGMDDEEGFEFPYGFTIHVADDKVDQVIEYYFKLTNDLPEVIKKETPTRLLVTVDCAENQTYGNRMVPLLLETNLSGEYKNPTVIKSNPLLFVPCSSKHINFIRVELLDEYLETHQFGGTKTVVKLILRPRGQVL